MSYTQITEKERYLIHHYLRQGHCLAEIGRFLKRHRSTISREIRRNLYTNGSYIVCRAQMYSHARRCRCRRRLRFNAEAWSFVCDFIKRDWSPEQVSLVFAHYGVMGISHETIYRYIWRDKKDGGRLYRHLRQSPKQRRKRYRSNDSRGVLRGKRGIQDRPVGATSRSERGHFEVDLMHSAKSTDCLLTLVDRKTRLVFIRKLKNKSAQEVRSALIPLIRKHHIRTLTADNGPEFHDYPIIEQRTGATFYFAAPYHSWERGTSENTNGLIRQYVPKRVSMARYTQEDCDAIAARLNSRPRKILNLSTPEEAHFGSEGLVALAG